MEERPYKDILYKYRSWDETTGYQKKILTERQLYFAAPSQFNDPFDCALPFRYDPKELTDDQVFLKLQDVISKAHPDKSAQEIHDICYREQQEGHLKDPDYWRNYHREFKDKVDNTFGIVSLTSKPDNILMWSHYADCHRGFCVGFNGDILYETVGGGIGHVIYSNIFPYTKLFDDAEIVIRHLNTKSPDWEYEDEYRITKHGYSGKVVTLPPEAYKEIVIGCKATQKTIEQILKTVDDHLPSTKVYMATQSDEAFKVNIYSSNLFLKL